MEVMFQRKSNRLKKFDYSQAGYYFVTICVKDMKCCFGEIINGTMVLNNYGKIAEQCWLGIAAHYQNSGIDLFTVMPNHVHGIIIIKAAAVGEGHAPPVLGRHTPSVPEQYAIPAVGAGHALPLQKTTHGLFSMIGSYKSAASAAIHKTGDKDFSWQRSFYDHVIRTEKSLETIREYIQNNPLRWGLDKYHPKNAIIR